VAAVADAELDRVLPAEAAALAEDPLRAGVVPLRVEAEARRPDVVVPVVAEAGQRARLLAHVALGVAALGAEGEELHQLTRVVLVRRPLLVLVPGEPEEHRRVARDREGELLERTEEVRAEELVLREHQLLGADAGVGGREPVVPDERHALDERTARAHHAVEPPEVVVAPGVVRRQPVLVVVDRRGADEALAAGTGQRADGAVQALAREPLRLTRPRAEAGTPEQALGLCRAEVPSIDRKSFSGCGGQRLDPFWFIGRSTRRR
jgi:hypothetical protein